jgi:hypothetical protein
MDNTSIESLKLVRSTNQDLLNFFNDSYISKLEQVQSLKTEEFELKAKIDQLLKTLDVYSFKTSTGHNVFSPFSTSTTSQQEKATQIEAQLRELQDIQSTLHIQIKEEEEETDLLKKRINSLSTSNRHLDELLSEATEEVSTISEDTTDSDTHPKSDEPPVNHGLNILRLQQYERKQLADKIQSDITDVLDSNFHKLEVLSWLIRSDINRAKVTLEELTTSTSKLADHVDEIANSLTNEVDSEEPVWTLLEKLIQNYKDEHTECDISSDIDCTDYAINIPDIVSTQLIMIIQELMNNIFTHSNANKIVIKIYLSSRLVDVYINDNGVGIDSNYSDESPWYSGLHKIKEIIYLLNGTFKIDGDIVSGTNVRFSFPLE